MENLLIKVCGLRDATNIEAITALNPDMIGHIFYDKSLRFLENPIEVSNKNSRRIGVFVDASIKEIIDHVFDFELNGIQLHGNEDKAFVIDLIIALAANNIHKMLIIKALGIENQHDLAKANEFESFVNYILLDTKTPKHGGSGQKFDWSILKYYNCVTPFILSGGIDIADVEDILKIEHENFAGVDINSKFEIEPGIKDVEKVELFIKKLRKNEYI